jgi:hypothetical protein
MYRAAEWRGGKQHGRSFGPSFAAATAAAAALLLLFVSPNPLDGPFGSSLRPAIVACVAILTLAGLCVGSVPRVQALVRDSEPAPHARPPHSWIPLVGALTGALAGLGLGVGLLVAAVIAQWAGAAFAAPGVIDALFLAGI